MGHVRRLSLYESLGSYGGSSFRAVRKISALLHSSVIPANGVLTRGNFITLYVITCTTHDLRMYHTEMIFLFLILMSQSSVRCIDPAEELAIIV
jgi:hypothetical protein